MLPPQAETRLPSIADVIPFVSCSTVCCGTSRVIVFFGEELPPDTETLHQFLYQALVGNNSSAEGLRGGHYQLNKIAVVFPGDWPAHINFLFFQLDDKNGRLVANLECGNLSVGAALMAVIRGTATLDMSDTIYATNLGTGQKMQLRPHQPSQFWCCDWTVRFIKDTDYREVYANAHPATVEAEGIGAIEYWIVEEGNVFFFVNAHPTLAGEELVQLIEREGIEQARMLGLDEEKSSLPKIIFYSTSAAGFDAPEVDACCFFKSEQHRSLPGSGSMSLASFLTASLLTHNGAPSPSGAVVFAIRHPSGLLDVAVSWQASDNEIFINHTSFTTPAKLLVHGRLAL